MTTKQKEQVKDNPFGDFGGTEVGAAEGAKWEFPGIGYNASSGIFYVDEDQVETLAIVPLAIRQCKEAEDINGTIHRYPVKTPRNKMIASDDVTNRLQVACVVNGVLYAFGARSWTARASFLNPRGGQWRDDKFGTGIWYLLEDWIKQQKELHAVNTTPLCWSLDLIVGTETTVGTGKNTSKSHPIVLAAAPKFVGKEAVAFHEAMYVENDLDGWIKEWAKISTETVEEVEPETVEEEEMPDGFAF